MILIDQSIRKIDLRFQIKKKIYISTRHNIKKGNTTGNNNKPKKEIREHEVVLETSDGEETLDNDFVLLLTGYRPNFGFLQDIGIKLSEDGKKIPEYNENTMETNIPGIFLAGVICGGVETHKWFIENSRVHAKMIMDYLSSKQTVNADK